MIKLLMMSVCLIVLLPAPSSAQQVYKCITAAGQVVLSDSPCGVPAAPAAPRRSRAEIMKQDTPEGRAMKQAVVECSRLKLGTPEAAACYAKLECLDRGTPVTRLAQCVKDNEGDKLRAQQAALTRLDAQEAEQQARREWEREREIRRAKEEASIPTCAQYNAATRRLGAGIFEAVAAAEDARARGRCR